MKKENFEERAFLR